MKQIHDLGPQQCVYPLGEGWKKHDGSIVLRCKWVPFFVNDGELAPFACYRFVLPNIHFEHGRKEHLSQFTWILPKQQRWQDVIPCRLACWRLPEDILQLSDRWQVSNIKSSLLDCGLRLSRVTVSQQFAGRGDLPYFKLTKMRHPLILKGIDFQRGIPTRRCRNLGKFLRSTCQN